MRLQVFLSKAGIVSRRAAAGIVKSGKVRVNGTRIFEPSFKVDPKKDKILLNNKIITERQKIYILLHKSKGVTTTKKDPHAQRTVMDLLPPKFGHLNPVGRLDKDTTGLILLTNDGELTNRLTHPKFNIEKMYVARLDRRLENRDRIRLENGIILDGKRTALCTVRLKHGNSVEIVIREGRKRQIRRMFMKAGYRVVALKRLREGSLSLGTLTEGRWRYLTEREISGLAKEIFFKPLTNSKIACKLYH